MLLMVMMVVMLMIMVVAAAAMLLMVMMVVMLMIMVVTAAAMLLMVMMMVMMLLLQLFQFRGNGSLACHGGDDLLTGQLIPGSGDQGCLCIVFPDQSHRSIQLVLCHGIGTGQNDGGSGFDLIVVELAKILHVDLHLACVRNGNGIAQGHFLVGNLFHSGNNVGQLAHTGGLDDDSVGSVLGNHLSQRLAEVTHQGAADAAGIHLGDVDSRILEEAAVNADFAEFIFDQNQLLTLVGFLNHLLDEGGFTGTQETGVNINFRHNCTPSVHRISPYIIPPGVKQHKKIIQSFHKKTGPKIRAGNIMESGSATSDHRKSHLSIHCRF